MQAAMSIAPTLIPLTPFSSTTKNFSQLIIVPHKLNGSPASRRTSVKVATVSSDNYTFDYSSEISVFPAEACETIGGEACWAGTFPETKLEQQPKITSASTEEVDREYLQYTDAKTVFRGEACDDLGGVFCEREYQKGVY